MKSLINNNTEFDYLLSKFVIDFSNGIDVSKNQITYQKSGLAFFKRIHESLNGNSQRRQIMINQNLTEGLSASFEWLTNITQSLAQSNYAISLLNEQVSVIQNDLVNMINFSVESRKMLDKLVLDVQAQCEKLNSELNRVDIEQKATRQLSQVFNLWESGKLNRFSVMQRCYIVAEKLRWGDFGTYYFNNKGRVADDLRNDFINRAIIQACKDLGVSNKADRLSFMDWNTNSKSPNQGNIVDDELQDLLEYSGDWSTEVKHPFVYTLTQKNIDIPIDIPRRLNANRFSEALAMEIFE